MPLCPPHTAVTSYDWIEHFYQNACEPALPWDDPYRLSPAERLAVARSIQQFQLGEGASGSRLLQCAESMCVYFGDKGYLAALRLFIQEEQRHSLMLRKFLERQGIVCLGKHWIHFLFRRIRGVGGLEVFMRVLAAAEVIARPYYTALREATGSPLLKAICNRILEEEAAHLRFQAFTFQKLQNRRHVLRRRIAEQLHCAFLLAVSTLVWIEHRQVFRAGGYSLKRFFSQSLAEFSILVRTES